MPRNQSCCCCLLLDAEKTNLMWLTLDPVALHEGWWVKFWSYCVILTDEKLKVLWLGNCVDKESKHRGTVGNLQFPTGLFLRMNEQMQIKNDSTSHFKPNEQSAKWLHYYLRYCKHDPTTDIITSNETACLLCYTDMILLVFVLSLTSTDNRQMSKNM